MTPRLEDIKYFAVNISDLTTLDFIQLLLVNDKIDTFSKVQVDKNSFDGYATVLHPTIKNDFSHNIDLKRKQQLYSTCDILTTKCGVRTYYSKNGSKFYKFSLNDFNNNKAKE